jgi:hypothetical protein
MSCIMTCWSTGHHIPPAEAVSEWNWHHAGKEESNSWNLWWTSKKFINANFISLLADVSFVALNKQFSMPY